MAGTSAAAQVTPSLQQGMLTILFEKDHRSVRPGLISLKSEHSAIVRTSFTIPMDGDFGLEIILVRGEPVPIRVFEQQLVAKRGIRSVRLTLFPS